MLRQIGDRRLLIGAHMMDVHAINSQNFIFSFARPFFTVFFVYYFMHRLLPNRLNVYTIALITSVYVFWHNLTSASLFGTRYHLLMNLFINALTLFVVLFLFKVKVWRKVIVWWYFELIKGMCEAVSYAPILLYLDKSGFRGQWPQIVSSVEAAPMLQLLYMAALAPLFLLFGFLSLTVWRRVLMQKFHPFYLFLIALPMGHRYSLALVIRPNMGDLFFGILINFVDGAQTAYRILSLLGIFSCLVAGIAIFYYILTHEKRAAIEADLREAKRVMELEQARYMEIEARGEELAKIRHDFNNQLMSIIQLIRAGEDAAAKDIFTALSGEIDRASGPIQSIK